MIVIIGGGSIAKSISNLSESIIIDSKVISEVETRFNNIIKSNDIKTVIITSGYLEKSKFEDIKFENIDKTISANMTYPSKVSKIVYKYLNSVKGNLIIFSSSVVFGQRNEYNVYAACKAGIEKLMENIRAESDINVKVVRNGRTDTPLRWKNYSRNTDSMKNLLSTEEVAETTLKFINQRGNILDIFKEDEHLNISIDRKS